MRVALSMSTPEELGAMRQSCSMDKEAPKVPNIQPHENVRLHMFRLCPAFDALGASLVLYSFNRSSADCDLLKNPEPRLNENPRVRNENSRKSADRYALRSYGRNGTVNRPCAAIDMRGILRRSDINFLVNVHANCAILENNICITISLRTWLLIFYSHQ
jgi:hypothetical protein